MKIIDIPADVVIPAKPPIPETPMKFKEFLVAALENYKPMGASVKMLRKLNKIVDAIEGAAGATIPLEDEYYDLVKASLHFEDGGDWMNYVARRVMPFFDAVENAQDVKK